MVLGNSKVNKKNSNRILPAIFKFCSSLIPSFASFSGSPFSPCNGEFKQTKYFFPSKPPFSHASLSLLHPIPCRPCYRRCPGYPLPSRRKHHNRLRFIRRHPISRSPSLDRRCQGTIHSGRATTK
ncbi:hypothetical protein V6N13_044988 [Hibiscus sabdariffa]